jgi:hypothetical protein
MSPVIHYAEIVSDWILRGVLRVWTVVDHCLFSRSTTYESLAWSLYDASGDSQNAQNYHELDIGDGDSSSILHHVRKSTGSHVVDKIAVHHIGMWRLSYELPDLFLSPPPPWLFIGYGIDEDVLIDCTEDMNCLVAYDNHVTLDILNNLVPQAKGQTWYYINPRTFEQAVFPAGGILIDEEPAPVSVSAADAESKKVD